MDYTSYLDHWAWPCSSSRPSLRRPYSSVWLALWLRLHWKPHARLRWVVAGVLLVASWAGLVLLWGIMAGQLVALREAITGYTGSGTLLTRALPVWGEGTLLGPTIAGLVQLFRPPRLVRQQPAQPALSEQPTQTLLRGVQRRLTLPSPAVKPEPSPPPDAPAERPS